MNLASGIWNISSFDKVKVGKFHEPRFYKERKGFKSGLSVNIYADSDQSNLVIWSSDEWLSEYARNLDPRYGYYSPVDVLNRIFKNSMSVTVLICSSRQRETMNSKTRFRAKPWNWDSWFRRRPYKNNFSETMNQGGGMHLFRALKFWLKIPGVDNQKLDSKSGTWSTFSIKQCLRVNVFICCLLIVKSGFSAFIFNSV